MNDLSFSKNHGFGLFELLVAMSLSALVVTSLLLFQVSLLQKTYDLWWHAVAWVRVSSLAEHLVATQGAHVASVVSRWQEVNKHLLPNVTGSGYCSGVFCHIDLKWGKSVSFHITQTIQVT